MESWNLRKKPMDGFIAFSSNVVTYQERALLPFGTYSASQNTRDYRPGLKKRPGLERLSTYNYIGSTVDIRPEYDSYTPISIHSIAGMSNASHPDIEEAIFYVDENELNPENDTPAGEPGVGVYATGDDANYGAGRVATTFTLHRTAPNVTVTAASMFIRLTDVPTYSTGDGVSICVVESDDNPNIDRETMNWEYAFYVGETLLADEKLISSAYAADSIVEIPFNAYGIAQINSILSDRAGGGRGQLTVCQREFNYDFTAPETVLNTESYFIEQRIDRYFPFLKLTFSGSDIACTSIYQYNIMRTGEIETLAFFANGDILLANVDPPTARGDVRTVASGGGDNGGYYPYSDEMPSLNHGSETSRAIASSYDSKWGSFIYRPGGLSGNHDWNQAYYNSLNSEFPPSFDTLDDILIVADGQGYARFYGGQDGQPVKASLVILDPAGDDTGTFLDNWDKDGIVVDLLIDGDGFGSGSEFYLFTPIVTNEYIIEVSRDNDGSGELKAYRWTGAAWAEVTAIEDGTEVGGVTLMQSGNVLIPQSYENPGLEDNVPQLFRGLSGYWTKFKITSDDVFAKFKVKAKYKFEELTNVWNGVLVDAIEARFYDDSEGAAGAYFTYSGAAIKASDMTSSDYVYFSLLDIPSQLYFDVGATPNTGATGPTLAFQYWNGASWQTLTVVDDETDGLTRSGFIRVSAIDAALSEKQAFQGSLWASYWFRMSTNQTFGDAVLFTITYEPVLDISDFGDVVNCAGVWKERCVYAFNKYPSWINITQNGTTNVLNGDDFAILQAGDGRRHKVVAMRKFQNELMVWQEEKGAPGGCLTLFEGYSPPTFGKLLLSAKIGTLNWNTVVVIDGALEASRTDYNAATLAYFISNYGVFYSDGQTVRSISAAIQNYFDPDHADCIRNGYQDKCWLTHDPTHQVLRLGLVSGSSATVPNIFPVYDLITRKWSFDAFSSSHILRCAAEVSGGTNSAVQVVLLAGTTAGDIFYASSTNLNDDGDTSIDMTIQIEFNDSGRLIDIREFAIRMKKQATGNCLFKAYENGVLNTEHNKTVDMTEGEANEETVVDRLILAINQEDRISITLQNDVINQDMYLYDFWLDSDSRLNR
jgi:hypothetical protein